MVPFRSWAPAALALLLALVLASSLTAQVREDHYEELRFSIEYGLPSNSIRALEFDKEGQLWIGTLAGLTVFDGNVFTSVPLCNEGAPLAHRVTALEMCADGALLIGTQGGTLLRYSQGVFETLPTDLNSAVQAIEELPEGAIVVAGQSLVSINEDEVRVFASSDRANRGAADLKAHEGSLYAAGPWGLWKLGEGSPELLRAGRYEALVQAPGGDLLAVRPGEVIRVNDPTKPLDLRLGSVYSSIVINEQMTMLACEDTTQLLFANGAPSAPILLMEDDTATRPRAFAVRRRGSWIGTDRNGLLYIERTPAYKLDGDAGAPALYARSVFQLDPDSAIVQPPRANAIRFTQTSASSTGTFDELEFIGGTPGPIFGCTSSREGVAWLASEAGVFRLEGVTARPAPCADGPVLAIVDTPSGEVWAAEDGSFFEVLPNGERGRSLPGPTPAPATVAASETGLYFAAVGGVYHLETSRNSGAAERILELTESVEPRWLAVDPQGDPWLTTYGDGLFCIRADGSEQYTVKDGLTCDYLGWINFVTDRNSGQVSVLLNSNRGLLTVPVGRLRAGLQSTGGALQTLSNQESEGPSGAYLACGTILLPTLRGLYGFRLDQGVSTNEPPRTVIDAVVVNDVDMDDGDEIAMAEVQGSADIDIGFTAIAMPSTADATFSYRLLSPESDASADVDWVNSFSAKSVQYFNLPPGTYTFEVRSKLPGTDWSAPVSARVVRVNPFLYQRPEAQFTLLALVLILLAYSFTRFIRAEDASQELTTQVEQNRTLAAEAAQREARYARLLDSSHDGIVLIESDGRISFANDAVTRSFGFERSELLEKDASWLGITDTLAILAAADGGESANLFSRNVLVDDKFGIPHESDLVAARTELDGKGCLLVVIRDLTADNLLLDRLDTSERRFQALFQGAPAALITFSSDLRLIDWNRRAEGLLGTIDSPEVKLSAAFESGLKRANFELQVQRTIETRSETRAVHSTTGSSGEKLRVNWTISPLTTDHGEVTVLMAVAKDLRDEEQAQARLVDLQRRLAKAQESERSRIAREIHDDLSQRLAATTMNAAAIRARLPETEDEEVPLMLDGLHDDLDRLTTDIHALSRQLHPTVLDDLGLARAIESECARQHSYTEAEVAFTGPREPLELPSDVALTFFRIAQESIRNAIKHGCPGSIDVRLSLAGKHLRLSVRDDGEGFETSEGRAESQSGLGLISMEERARLIGATFSLDSSPKKGTSVTVEFVLEGKPAASVAP